MNRLLVYDPERGFRRNARPAEISDILKDGKRLVWLDLDCPDAAERAILRDEFGFHPLAIEDVENAHQRPKVETYPEFYFQVLYTISMKAGEEGVRLSELAVFIGPNYLVTVHMQPIPVLDEVAGLWQNGHSALRPGAAGLLHLLLDAVVDDYFPIMDAIGERIDDLEDRVFSAADPAAMQPIFRLKKDLLALRRVIAPERDGINTLMRRELPFIEPDAVAYLQDVYDHLSRLVDSVDTFRDLMSSVLDAHLTVVSNRLNQVMKTMTALATILMTLSLVAGIYGMNLRNVPEPGWRWGFHAVVGGMLALGVGLVAYFRRIRWL